MIIGTAYAVYLAADHVLRITQEETSISDMTSRDSVEFGTVASVSPIPTPKEQTSTLSIAPCLATKLAPEALRIQGLDHFEDVNGFYTKDSQRSLNNRPIYAKENSSVRLWFFSLDNSTHLWMISEEEHLETQDAYACVESHAFMPTEIDGTWMSYNVIQKAFLPNKGVSVTEMASISEDLSELPQEVMQRKEELLRLKSRENEKKYSPKGLDLQNDEQLDVKSLGELEISISISHESPSSLVDNPCLMEN